MQAERGGWAYFIKLFWGTHLAVLIALLAFWVRPCDLDPRFGLGIGAIFAAMANAYVISDSLPESQIMTLADMIGGIAIFFIFLSLAISATSLRVWNAGKEQAALRIDHLAFVGLLLLYVVANVLVTWP